MRGKDARRGEAERAPERLYDYDATANGRGKVPGRARCRSRNNNRSTVSLEFLDTDRAIWWEGSRTEDKSRLEERMSRNWARQDQKTSSVGEVIEFKGYP
jgi:hypothetical protein